MIKQAVEKIYGVKVHSVRTSNRKGKPRRVRFKFGTTSDWKKAVVVLRADHHIDLF
jgi:large subunit ribosomal protein L23